MAALLALLLVGAGLAYAAGLEDLSRRLGRTFLGLVLVLLSLPLLFCLIRQIAQEPAIKQGLGTLALLVVIGVAALITAKLIALRTANRLSARFSVRERARLGEPEPLPQYFPPSHGRGGDDLALFDEEGQDRR